MPKLPLGLLVAAGEESLGTDQLCEPATSSRLETKSQPAAASINRPGWSATSIAASSESRRRGLRSQRQLATAIRMKQALADVL